LKPPTVLILLFLQDTRTCLIFAITVLLYYYKCLSFIGLK